MKMNRPFAMLYTTKSGHIYVYDPLTNRIISVDSTADFQKEEEICEDVYSYLSEAGEIRSSHFSKICWQLPFDAYREKVEFEIPVLLLELTKRCSLRCGYCTVRTDDSHGSQCAEGDMCEETVYRSIDFYAAHSLKCQKYIQRQTGIVWNIHKRHAFECR